MRQFSSMDKTNIYEQHTLNYVQRFNYLQGLKGSSISDNNSFLSIKENYLSNLYNSNFYSEKMNINYEIEIASKWYKIIDSMEFKFDKDNSICFIEKVEKCLEKDFSYKTLKIFEVAVNTYLEEKKTNNFFKEISANALKNFLYILPTIEKYSPILNIESDTGYINSTFTTKEHGILRALSTDKGEIHFSRVSEDIRIYKISGVFKIKDSRDFRNFEKVLRML